jgi:hypothetical protein
MIDDITTKKEILVDNEIISFLSHIDLKNKNIEVEVEVKINGVIKMEYSTCDNNLNVEVLYVGCDKGMITKLFDLELLGFKIADNVMIDAYNNIYVDENELDSLNICLKNLK